MVFGLFSQKISKCAKILYFLLNFLLAYPVGMVENKLMRILYAHDLGKGRDEQRNSVQRRGLP